MIGQDLRISRLTRQGVIIQPSFKLTSEMIDKEVVNINTWLQRSNWMVKPEDVTQAKADEYAAEYRENWNKKWDAISDIICSKKFFKIKKEEHQLVVDRLN